MKFGIKLFMATYSGGLGILAGDTMRAAADLGLGGLAMLRTLGYQRGSIT